MANFIILTLINILLAAEGSPEFRHLRTYGSKDGIKPPRIANKKAAIAATGQSEHPYGLGFPVAVATDSAGRLWITDSATASIHIFDPATGAYREVRKAGDATLRQPAGIATDYHGRIYVVDTALANVFVFEDGEYARTLLKPEDHTLTAPTTIAISEDRATLYIADPPKNQILALNREGEVNSTIPLTEAARDPIAIEEIDHELYVLGGRRQKLEIFSPKGERRRDLRWDGVANPTAFAYDREKSRFLVANPRLTIIEVFRPDGHSIAAFGQLGDRPDQHRRMEFLHVDAKGHIYSVDSHHGKVLVFAEGR
jgi:hypothetical protein